MRRLLAAATLMIAASTATAATPSTHAGDGRLTLEAITGDAASLSTEFSPSVRLRA